MESNKPQIFIVDDSGLERRILRDALEKNGYGVREFVDGRDVLTWLRCLEDSWPDMILLDAMMRVKDGFETCEAIKNLPKGREIPILMITAREDSAAIERAFDCGAEDFIVKPVNMTLLHRRIERIIKARRADETVRMMAFTDLLTGLPNRRLFENELERWLNYARRNMETLAVAFLDLDRFKQVNDNWGHETGDKVLIEMARRLQGEVRSTDFVARLGGDEFMMILPGVGERKSLLRVISSIFEICDHPILPEFPGIRIGVSMGVSFFPEDGNDIGSLMKKADISLYRSKEKKGNTFTCYSDEN